jgi:hypothetical protein
MLLDFLIPPSGCSISHALWTAFTDCGAPSIATMLHAAAAAGITLVLVWAALAVLRRAQIREEGNHG